MTSWRRVVWSSASGSAAERSRARAARSGGAAEVGLAQGRLALERVAVGEVEAGFGAGAGAGDIAPLLQGALVAEEDVGAVDGGALGGVAGERVAVLEVLGGVAERDRARGAAVVAEGERRASSRSTIVRAGAVADAEPGVVSSAEDLVADPELALAERPALRVRAARFGA